MGEVKIMDPFLSDFQKALLSQSNIQPSEVPYLYDEVFITRLKGLPEASKYVMESVKHSKGEQSDPNYVLIFRRTVPQNGSSKPEKHWGLEYLPIRNGLNTEIRGTQREKSRIYVSTIGLLEKVSGTKANVGGLTDGELQINDDPIDLDSASLFSIKPANYLVTDS